MNNSDDHMNSDITPESLASSHTLFQNRWAWMVLTLDSLLSLHDLARWQVIAVTGMIDSCMTQPHFLWGSIYYMSFLPQLLPSSHHLVLSTQEIKSHNKLRGSVIMMLKNEAQNNLSKQLSKTHG